jgi:hypothetical protein
MELIFMLNAFLKFCADGPEATSSFAGQVHSISSLLASLEDIRPPRARVLQY